MTDWNERFSAVLMNTYGPRSIALDRGEGPYVWDVNGKRYLDFLGGIAVNALGYGHPALVEAVTRQIKQLHHCTNLFFIPREIELAEVLTRASGLEGARIFVCNSGAEANECALKLARLYSNTRYAGQGGRPDFISFLGSFHGRTFATMAATGQDKTKDGYAPHFPHFHYARVNDIGSVEALMNERIGGVLIEPVQGEGGIRPADPGFLRDLRQLCDEHDVPLIFDEIQCGIGRTGHRFAFQHFGVEPDVITLAKGLGGGVPIGACLARGRWAEVFTPGKHGSTFGGNPLACAAALAVLGVVFDEAFLEQVREVGRRFIAGLRALQARSSLIRDVRGVGLMIGIELAEPGAELVKKIAQDGLLLNCTATNVLRIVPPLIINESHADEALAILEKHLIK